MSSDLDTEAVAPLEFASPAATRASALAALELVADLLFPGHKLEKKPDFSCRVESVSVFEVLEFVYVQVL